MKKPDMEARRESVWKPLKRAGWEKPSWFTDSDLAKGRWQLRALLSGGFELHGPLGVVARFTESMPASAIVAAAKAAAVTLSDVTGE